MSTRDHPDWGTQVQGSNSQESTLERRSMLWNDNGVLDGVAPPNNLEGVEDRGKFFTRGARGKIEQVHVYCTGNGVNTLRIWLSPHPCLGPLYAIQIIPAAGWAWQAFNLEYMWDYDSLFIWIENCQANVSWGYDEVQPYDGHISADGGVTWADWNARPYIRVIYTGETPGDVPISGIINNIQIPNTSSGELSAFKDILAATTTELCRVDGIGYVSLLDAYVDAAGNSHRTQIIVECDGVYGISHSFSWLNTRGFNDDTQPLSLITYAEDGECVLMYNHKWEFRRVFRLLAYNAFAAVRVHYDVHPTLMM